MAATLISYVWRYSTVSYGLQQFPAAAARSLLDKLTKLREDHAITILIVWYRGHSSLSGMRTVDLIILIGGGISILNIG